MENQQQEQTLTFWEKNRMLIKGLIIGILILLMLIPAAMLSNLVTERQERQAEVVKNISDKWASDQTIIGPVIKLPYLTKTSSDATEAQLVLVCNKDALAWRLQRQ
jgi:inner membrane protein